MQRTLAIINQKGGVGKTTVTLGLASAAAESGARVLVVDLDPQGSSTWVLGIDPATVGRGSADALRGEPADRAIVASAWSAGVDLMPATPALQRFERGKAKRLRKALASVVDRYAAVLVDCPPSNADLTVNALTAARHALVVVEPSTLGLRGLGALADTVDRVWDDHNPALELSGVVVNRVPAISAEADRRIEELALIVGASAIWTPFVAQRVVLNQAVGDRLPIHAYGSRAADSIETFDALWARVAETVAA